MPRVVENTGTTYALNENYQRRTVTGVPVLYKTVARATGESRVVVVDAEWFGWKNKKLSKTKFTKVEEDPNFVCYAKLPVRVE